MKKVIFVILTGIFFTGCWFCQPEIKYVYIKQKCPTLQKIDINDLNLSEDKKIKLHIKVKDQ